MYPDKTNILVVDNQMQTRQLIERVLRDAGFAVTVVSDGLGAIRAAGQQRFALVIAATDLPGTLDGATTVRHLRTRQPRLGVLLTGPVAARPWWADSRGGEFIGLPFEPRDFLGSVFALLQRDMQRDAPCPDNSRAG